MKTKAFTLIELLVVIAIIALLMAIILPALNMVKRKAATTVCLSNTKNLSVGWYMYMGDNDGRIMSSTAEATDDKGTHVGWCREPRDGNGNRLGGSQISPAVTDEDEIRGIKMGVLYPYIKSPKAYHCPADNVRKSMYDETTVFVSYAIPACLYQAPKSSHARYNIQIRIFDEISSPSKRYVFVAFYHRSTRVYRQHRVGLVGTDGRQSRRQQHPRVLRRPLRGAKMARPLYHRTRGQADHSRCHELRR